MPITYILQQLDALKGILRRLEDDYYSLKSENRKEIQELKNRIRLLEQSYSTETKNKANTINPQHTKQDIADTFAE